MPTSQPGDLCAPLTTADILAAVDDVLAHGWGRVHIVITEHYVKIVEPTKTILGKKPPSPDVPQPS